VGAGADLGRGPVELVDGGFGGWEGCEGVLVSCYLLKVVCVVVRGLGNREWM